MRSIKDDKPTQQDIVSVASEPPIVRDVVCAPYLSTHAYAHIHGLCVHSHPITI